METERENGGNRNDSDSESRETIVFTESRKETNDTEYVPTTSDSEESTVSIVEKKATKKKQTTITNTFHLTKKDMNTMTQMRGTKENEVNKHQTRSMRKYNN